MYRNTLTTMTAVLTLTINLVLSQVVINEIHYNPATSQGSDNDYEFMELYNPGATDIDMSGYYFTQGVTHTFADGTTLPAGGYILLTMPTANGDVDYNVYDPDGDGFHESGAAVIDWTSGGQSNGGEDIEIVYDVPGVDGNGDGDFDDLGVDNNGDGDFDDAGVDNNGDGDFDDPGVDNNGDGDFDDPGVDANGDGDFDDEGDTAPDVAPDVLADVAPVDTAPSTVVVDFVDYEDGTNDYGNWEATPGNHDGGGSSLELIDATSDNSLAASWQGSWVLGGTPGAPSSTEPEFTVVTIYNIQYTTDANGASPLVGEQVQTTGIVTGVDRLGTNSAFTIQSGSGAWTGIYCWWAADEGVVVGDEVTVRGTVTEYAASTGDANLSMTELVAGSIVSVNSSGNTLPQPVVLDVEDVGQEMYEGVLVTTTGRVVEAAVCDSDEPNYNYCEWRITNNLDASMTADTVSVNDRFAVTTPALGTIATVTGPLNQWSGSSNSGPSWRIEPASEEDVTIECQNADLAIDVEMLDSFGDGWNGGYYEIRGPQGTLVGTGGLENGFSGVDTYCLFEADFFIYVIADNYPEEISFNVKDAFGNTLISGGMANSSPFEYPFSVTGINETTGCTDPVAVNYDYTAALDDGSCYYYGDICADPIAMTGGSGVAASDMDQWFSYTAAATGNMTVSSVGQTEEDTYLVILSSCDIGYEYETDPVTGDTLYVTEFFADLLATNDDADYGTGVYQSEATICVTAGESYIIGWISMYYPYDESFSFTVEETADITTPVNMSAYGDEVGISVEWDPIPVGCAEASASSRSGSMGQIRGHQLKTKPGAHEFVYSPNKKREMNHKDPSLNERSEGPTGPYLTRDCPEEQSTISFYTGGGSWASERSWDVSDADGNLVASGTSTNQVDVCLPNGSYVVNGYDSFGDGWNGGLFYVVGPLGIMHALDVVPTGASGSFDFEIEIDYNAVYGCTDNTALNYDAAATEDDGSCQYTGDICTAPFDNAGAPVSAGSPGWYTFNIPAEAGILSVSHDDPYGNVWVVVDCDYSVSSYDYYDGLIAYQSGNTIDYVFSSDNVNFGATQTTDAYLGTTVLIYAEDYGYGPTSDGVSISYAPFVAGCTDPNSSNYNPDANLDDGSCICGGVTALMTMNDSYGDGWNGNTYIVVDASGAEVASGGLASGSNAVDEICIPGDGTYSIYVGTAPATPGSWQSEISWSLTSAETGFVIAAGGAPYTPTPGDGTFNVPLPAYTFQLYRNDVLLDGALVAAEYYDQAVVSGTEYCYTVTQTEGAAAPSGHSEPDCDDVYVPSTCQTAVAVVAHEDSVYHMDGINGRNEWFYYVPTMEGYLTVTSDIPGQMGGDTRVMIYGNSCDSLVQIGYDDDGGTGLLTIATQVVFPGDTVWIEWTHNYSPGPSIWALYEFPAGHQPPNNVYAWGDHEMNHLSWDYPLDAYSNAVRSVEPNGNSVEENMAQISYHENMTEKLHANREELYQAYLNNRDETDNSRTLEGTSVEILGSVLNDDGTADIFIGLDVVSANTCYLDAARYTFPDGATVLGAVDDGGTMSSSTSQIEVCEIVVDAEANSATFGDGSFIADTTTGSGWGCLSTQYHTHVVNVSAYTEPITMSYHFADDCWQAPTDPCDDQIGTIEVPVPTDEPLCFPDAFEPNDFLEAPDTWTEIQSWGFSASATVCPGDVDIYNHRNLAYGGWVHATIVDLESTGQMEVTLWDLGISDYALDYYVSDYEGDTITIHYQNYGGLDGSQGETDVVISVEGTTNGASFNYSMNVEIQQPEVYTYNIHDATTDAVLVEGITGYNYTHHGLTNGTEHHYYAVTVNVDGLISDTSDHVSATPRADQLFPPANLVGEPWLESVNLHWDAPPSLTPGNVVQSAFHIPMLPFEDSGNTAAGFENNYDDCSDISDSPEAVYKFTPTADVNVSISTCYSSFDTKVYVFENTTSTVVACNEDAGFDDYYYCGYYTSYADSVAMTANNDYYIVVDGWGGDAGFYNLQVFETGDTSYTEGWDMNVVTVDPNHDREAKALAVEQNLANLEVDNSASRSLTGYEVLKENSGVWDVIATTGETMYSDMGLATSTGESYSYKVRATYHGGTSEGTEAVVVTPFAPIDIPTPVNFTGSANGWIVELDWEQPDLGGGDLAYAENFDDGTLGTMTTEDLTPDGGPVWVAGTSEDATSQYWSPPENGNFAFYNDDFHEYNYSYTDARLTSAAIDVSALGESAVAGLSLVGDLYFTQPSGPCDGGGTYSEELDLMVSVDGGDWESRGLINSTAGWEMVELPLGLPGTASSVKVGLRYSDCGGNWGYGVAVDNFSVMVPPELDLVAYNLYKNGEMMASLEPGTDSFLDVVTEEGTYSYGLTTVLTMYGESVVAGPIDVAVAAPAPAMNPPRNLVVEPSGLAADLEWDPPAGGDQWIGHDNGMIGNALGGEDAFDFQVAARFPAQDLVEFQGKQLQEVMFAGGSNVSGSSYQVLVHSFSPGGTADSSTLVYQSEIIPGSELEELGWNYHELEEPLLIPLGTELWIGLRCISNGGVETYPAVVDNGVTHNGLGNMINGFGSDGYVSLQDVFGLEGNWMIRGYISWPITNVLSNSSFEGWYANPDGWQNFPNDFTRMGSDGAPYGNMFVDPDGAGIYGSPDGSTLDVYEGGHALKMWGMYAGGENMWGSVYQTFTAADLGGAGSMFEISAAMMSHAHDWIGQGTSSVRVFASYWEGPYGYTYMGADYSDPFDGTFTASEWHVIDVLATIPDGATYINIGIELLQPNNDQHGSVYLDDFVAAPYNPAVVEESVTPVAVSELGRKRNSDSFRDQGRPMLLFDQYIQENNYRDLAFEFLGYKVYRDGVAIDTLGLGEHMHYDVVGESGEVIYHVSAMYEEDGTGTINEANSNMVTVDLQNAAPTAVNLISPENETLITLTPDNVAGSDLGIFWSNSSDADGDQVEYTLSLHIEELDDHIDTTLIGTNIFLPYSDLYELITDLGVTMLNITWNVETNDEWASTMSANGPWTLTVDAGWMLSAEEELLPEVFALHNNYPNPFNPITNIRYDIPEVSDVRIDIYNINGQRVRTLVSREHQPGRYKVQWNATNEFGSPVASGMYIYKIYAKDFTSVKKLLLMK